VATLQVVAQRHNAPAQRQHQPDGQLGDSPAIDTGCEAHHHALTSCGVEVYRVEPDAVLADDTQLGQRSEDSVVEDLESDNRSVESLQERDELVAPERPTRLVEFRRRITPEQLLPEDRTL
jgi:hypothetical protein